MSEEWEAPPNWDLRTYQAIDRFVLDAKVSKEALAGALGMDAASLSLSHLSDRKKSRYLYQRLPYTLHRRNLSRIAIALELDLRGCKALETLIAEVLSINSGFVVDPNMLLADAEHAVEYGMVGVELMDRGQWDAAMSHLQSAWSVLGDREWTPDERTLLVALRVGTQIASWHSHVMVTPETVNLTKTLLSWCRSYRGTDRSVWEAIALMYKGAGVVFRHTGWHPEMVIEKLEVADQIVATHDLAAIHRAAALRDQAKPYVRWGLMTGDQERVAHAFAALDTADRLIDHVTEDAQSLMERALNRHTRVECLAAVGQTDAARHQLGLLEHDAEIQALGQRTYRTLGVRLRLAEIAVLIANHQIDAAGEAAKRFQADPQNSPFGSRLGKAARLQQLACQGDEFALRKLLVR